LRGRDVKTRRQICGSGYKISEGTGGHELEATGGISTDRRRVNGQ